MRKIILALLFVSAGTALQAQNFNDVDEKIKGGKWAEAKEKLAKFDADAKATAKSDYWFLKAKIYGNLAKANGDSATMAQGFEAMNKYLQMESAAKGGTAMMRSVLENHQTAFDFYSTYANNGIKSFQAKNWPGAYYNFTQSLAAFDMLAKNKLTTATFDTTMTIYAGFSAQNAGMQDNAAKYYAIIADARIADTTYADLYEYLVSYYNQKKDAANTAKYLALGKELFPKRESWLAYELDALGTDRAQRIAGMEKMVQANPTNFNLALDYAVELFNYTYGKDKPSDYSARLDQLSAALKNAVSLNPTNAYGNYIMTQHLSNQIYDLQQEYNGIRGTKPEDVKKKADINKNITSKYEELLPYANAAYASYEGMANIKAGDKANWRNVTNLLADYYTMKKDVAKAKMYDDKAKTLK